MVERERMEKALAKALATVRGAEADIVAVDTEIRLARFSNNEIHQNSVLSDTDFTVRVARGQKVGIVKTNRASELKDAVGKAYDLAGMLPIPCSRDCRNRLSTGRPTRSAGTPGISRPTR